MENSDWKGYAARQRESKKNGKLRGRSVCFYIEFGGIFNDRMDMKFDPSGSLTIYGGTHSHGQGHATVFAQLAHEMLGVPFEQIRYVQGDTAQVAIGRGTYGARSMVVGGNALKFAADQMIEKGKKIAAAMMEADAGDIEFKDGELPRHRHRQGDQAGRCRQGDLRADGADRRQVRHRPRSRPAASTRRRRAIPTARMWSSSRSTRTPARSASTATMWSTTSAASSIR